MKKYGIYLAYPPEVNLLVEGLGRYLIEFLKKASNCQVVFVIACPSWMRESLLSCLDEANVDENSYEIIGPKRKPFLLTIYEEYNRYKSKVRIKNKKFTYWVFQKQKIKLILESRIAALRFSIPNLLIGSVIITCSIFVLLLNKLISLCCSLPFLILKKTAGYVKGNKYLRYLKTMTANTRDSGKLLHLYKLMHEAETRLMNTIINSRQDIKAWYCPTGFWPSFNAIKAPRLICIPDVVLNEFAVGFSVLSERYLESYKQIEKTISEDNHFVTYSEEIKRNTLVRSYHRPSSKITVIPHGASQLDEYIAMDGFENNKASTSTFCRNLLQMALNKAVDGGDIYKYKTYQLDKNHMGFLFYASQFRPNKNIITLLRAYKYLLRKRFIQLKLILTGNPYAMPEIIDYIRENQLQNDVLCLHGLSNQELAACYHLASLSINPSFSEGGCPFTFTESLSVDTPVVMARIPVTEEVIKSEELQKIMLFNPYDWKDMADRILWGLENRSILLQQQKLVYNQLAQRTWTHVVEDYIAVLDKISNLDKYHLSG
jgi:glycosyltransferase involved in cell wall biosynthesis